MPLFLRCTELIRNQYKNKEKEKANDNNKKNRNCEPDEGLNYSL